MAETYVDHNGILKMGISGSSSATDRRVKRGEFPKPAGYIGERKVWRLSEIERWVAEQLARPPEEQTRSKRLRKRAASIQAESA